jgi:hypothetical protein
LQWFGNVSPEDNLEAVLVWEGAEPVTLPISYQDNGDKKKIGSIAIPDELAEGEESRKGIVKLQYKNKEEAIPQGSEVNVAVVKPFVIGLSQTDYAFLAGSSSTNVVFDLTWFGTQSPENDLTADLVWKNGTKITLTPTFAAAEGDKQKMGTITIPSTLGEGETSQEGTVQLKYKDVVLEGKVYTVKLVKPFGINLPQTAYEFLVGSEPANIAFNLQWFGDIDVPEVEKVTVELVWSGEEAISLQPTFTDGEMVKAGAVTVTIPEALGEGEESRLAEVRIKYDGEVKKTINITVKSQEPQQENGTGGDGNGTENGGTN